MRKKINEADGTELRDESLQEILDKARPPESQEELDSMDKWPSDDRE